jgi:hypothetical protein
MTVSTMVFDSPTSGTTSIVINRGKTYLYAVAFIAIVGAGGIT